MFIIRIICDIIAIQFSTQTKITLSPNYLTSNIHHYCSHCKTMVISVGYSREQVSGHSLFLNNLPPINGWHGPFGFRRNTPWLRRQPSVFIGKWTYMVEPFLHNSSWLCCIIGIFKVNIKNVCKIIQRHMTSKGWYT